VGVRGQIDQDLLCEDSRKEGLGPLQPLTDAGKGAAVLRNHAAAAQASGRPACQQSQPASQPGPSMPPLPPAMLQLAPWGKSVLTE
jgi:hypothetical protein